MIPPRPWVAVEGEIDKFSVNTKVPAWIEHSQEESVVPWPLDKDLADHIARAVNAFDALLAVAKAADATADHPSGSTYVLLEDAVRGLYAAHPGWREWTT